MNSYNEFSSILTNKNVLLLKMFRWGVVRETPRRQEVTLVVMGL